MLEVPLRHVDSNLMPFLQWCPKTKRLIPNNQKALSIQEVIKNVEGIPRLLQEPATTLRWSNRADSLAVDGVNSAQSGDLSLFERDVLACSLAYKARTPACLESKHGGNRELRDFNWLRRWFRCYAAIDTHHEPDRHTNLSQQRGIGLLSSQAYIQ